MNWDIFRLRREGVGRKRKENEALRKKLEVSPCEKPPLLFDTPGNSLTDDK